MYDVKTGLLNVPYLVIDENKRFHLKEKHQYYAQVQVLLYVLNLQVCQFIVYSPVGSVIFSIARDNAYLKTNIPKLEKFYFQMYLTALCSSE